MSTHQSRASQVGATVLLLTLSCMLGAHGATPALSGPSAQSPFLAFGPVKFRPHLHYSGSYNDGLPVREGFAANTYIDTFSPGFILEFNERWSVDYTPIWTVYSNPAFRDTLGHAVRATGGMMMGKSALAFTQTYTYSANPLAETGRQTDTEVAGTDLTAVHVLSRVFALDGGFSQKLTFVSASPDFHEWTTFGGLQANLSDATSVRASVYSGYAAVYKAADMAYVAPRGEITWSPMSPLTFSGGVSIDYRVVLSRRWRWLENLLYVGSFRYEPFAASRVEGKVERTLAPSLFNGQTADATRWSFSGEQRILGHFWFSGEMTYDHLNYLTTGRSEAFRRKDHRWSYRAAVRTTFLRRGGVSVSYQDTDNSSNLAGYRLKSSRIACDVSWRY